MSESNPFHPEQPKSPQEILASLGDKFAVALDVCLEAVDERKLDIEALVKNIPKLHPQYLEHVRSLFENSVTKILEEKKPFQTDKEIDTEKSNLANSLYSFIERIEFFRRLNPPEKVPTGGKTAEQLEEALAQANIEISDLARAMMHKETTTDEYGTFTTTQETKTIDLVRLKVKDLFRDKKNHAFKEILDKAQELGLELCESEDGPNYRLHYTNQPQGEWIWVGMKQISDSDGDPRVFRLDRTGDEPWLFGVWTDPADVWDPEYEFVLRLSSSSSQVTL